MRASGRAGLCLSAVAVIVVPCMAGAPPQSQTMPAQAGKSGARDGQHDFDFELGSWQIHLRKLVHPLSGSNEWVRFDGTSVTRPVWDGKAQLEEFQTNGAAGKVEGLTLRTYDPATAQWNLFWATSRNGAVFPPQIGKFRGGVGEFYGMDTQDGKSVLVRFLWTNTTTDTPHFEQSFSVDGGKTWEVNWITDQTRVKSP
jgi:hypothetical protein